MSAGHSFRTAHLARRGRSALATAIVIVCLASPAVATADYAWLSLGVLGGTVRHDPGFSDFRWNAAPEPAWGVQALVGHGRFAAGIRTWRAHTEQSLDLTAVPDPDVVRSHWDLVVQTRVATTLGVDLLAIGGIGRARIAFDPDHVDMAGPSGPLRIEFDPVDEWSTAFGLGVRRPLAGAWAATLEVDHRRFAMDTAHRNGNAVTVERRAFGDWSARVELSFRHGR